MSLLANKTPEGSTSSVSNKTDGIHNVSQVEDDSGCVVQNLDEPNDDKANDKIVNLIPNLTTVTDLTIETDKCVIIDVLTVNPDSRVDKPTNNAFVKSASNLKRTHDEQIDSTRADDRSTTLHKKADHKLNITSCITADDATEITNFDTVLTNPHGKETTDVITSGISEICDTKDNSLKTENSDVVNADKGKNIRPVYARKTSKRKRPKLTLKKCAKKKKYEDSSASTKRLNTQNIRLNKNNSNSNDLKDYDKGDIQEKSVEIPESERDNGAGKKDAKSSSIECKLNNKTKIDATDDTNGSRANLQIRDNINRECKKGVKYFQNEDYDNDDSSVDGKMPEDETDIDSDGTIDLDDYDSQETVLLKRRGRPKRVEAKCDKSEISEVLQKKRGRPLQKGDFKCAKCDFVTNLRKNFAIHKRHCRPSLKCKYCDFTTRTMQTYIEHEAKHTKERPFKCDQCNYACRYKADLYHHRAKHLSEKTHKCPHCDFVTKWRRNIYHHLLRHTEDRPFSCDLCGFSFKRIQDLKYHLYRHNENKPIFCEQCEFRCKTNYELKCHMLKHSDERKFACTHPGCTQRVKSKSDLTKHMKTHLAVKPHSCEICGKGFKTIACLNKHKQRHTDHRPFSCDICQRKFKVKTSLRNHIKLHAGIKPFSCGVCGHRFSNKSNMKVHTKTHEVEDRPFRCPICPHGSKTKAHLLAHIGSMHGSSFAYFCELCKKPFKRYHQLDVHYTRMHTKKELDSLRNLSDFTLNIKQEREDEIKEESSYIENLDITGNIKNEIDENEFNKILSEGSDSTEDYTDQGQHLEGVNNSTLQPHHLDAEINSNNATTKIVHKVKSKVNSRKDNETTSDLEIHSEIITNLDTGRSIIKSKSFSDGKVKDPSRNNMIIEKSADDESMNMDSVEEPPLDAVRDIRENNGVDNEFYKTADSTLESNSQKPLFSVNVNKSSDTVSNTSNKNVSNKKEISEESGTNPKTYEPYPSLFEHAPATLAMYDGFRLPLATKGFEFNLDKTGKKPRSWFMDPANIYNKDYRDHQMRYLDKQRRLYNDIKPKVSNLPKRRGRPSKRSNDDSIETPNNSDKKRKLNNSHLQKCVVSLEKIDLSKSKNSISKKTESREAKGLFETFNDIALVNQCNLSHENRSSIKDDNFTIEDTSLDCKTAKKKNLKKDSMKVKNVKSESKLLKNTVKRKIVTTKTKSKTTLKKKTKITNTNTKNVKKVKKQTKTVNMKKKGPGKKTTKIKTTDIKSKKVRGKIKIKSKAVDVCSKKKLGKPTKKAKNIVGEVTTQTDFDVDAIKIEDTGIDYSCLPINDGTIQNPESDSFTESSVQYVIVEPKANTKIEEKLKQSILVPSKPLFKGCKRKGKASSAVNAKVSKKTVAKSKSKGKRKTSKKLKVKLKPRDKKNPKQTETKKDKVQSSKKRIGKKGTESTGKGNVVKRKTGTKGTYKKKAFGDEFVIEWNTQAEVEELLHLNAVSGSSRDKRVGMDSDAAVTDIYMNTNTQNTTIKQEIQNIDDANYGVAARNESDEMSTASFAECVVNPCSEQKDLKFCDDVTIMQRLHGSEIDIITACDIVPNNNSDRINETEQNLQKSGSLNHLGIIVNPPVNVCNIGEPSTSNSDQELRNLQQMLVSTVSNGHVQPEGNQQQRDDFDENGEDEKKANSDNTTKVVVLCKDEPPMDVEYLKHLYENE